MIRCYEQPVANALVEKRSRIRKSPEILTEKVCFEVTFDERSKRVIVSRSQVRRVSWMRNGSWNNVSRVNFATCDLGYHVKSKVDLALSLSFCATRSNC